MDNTLHFVLYGEDDDNFRHRAFILPEPPDPTLYQWHSSVLRLKPLEGDDPAQVPKLQVSLLVLQ